MRRWALILIILLYLPFVFSYTNNTFRSQEGYYGNATGTLHFGAFSQYIGNITTDLCYGFFCAEKKGKFAPSGGLNKFEKSCGVNLTGIWLNGEWVCIPTKELIFKRKKIEWLIVLTLTIPFIFIFLYRRKKKKEELLLLKKKQEEKNVRKNRIEILLE